MGAVQETSSMRAQPEHAAELCQEAEVAGAAAPGWGLARRVGFRFLFSYFVLYAFPFPLGMLPWTAKLEAVYSKLTDALVLWAGPNLLRIDGPIPTESTSSGDRTYDYVLMFCLFALSLAAAAVWSAIDRRPRRHDRLLRGLRLYVRVYLGAMMLSYGFAKIFEHQFITPDKDQLLETYGQASPMNLLWTLMGFSRPYCIFGGLMEAVPGALLFARRTATAGALLLLAVLANVVLLNFCYDVPVKLFSSHLWLMALFLAAPAIPRLVALLVFERPVAPPVTPPSTTTRRARIVATSLHALLLVAVVYQTSVPEWKESREFSRRKTVAIRDLYSVDEMTVDGAPQPALPTNAGRWKRVSIRRRGIIVYGMDDRSQAYYTPGEIRGPRKLVLRTDDDERLIPRAHLDLRQSGDGYTVDGDFEGKKVHAHLSPIPAESFLLMNRGFHWINEVPFNR
jgi:hypothetical protein